MIATLAGAVGLGAHDPSFWMPLLFAALLFAIALAGTVLDGFDIGLGCLLPWAHPDEQRHMLSLLSPWRDANEFWLLLGLGVLASAFPRAWSAILGQLYLPLTFLGLGVLLRSTCFEMRLRSPQEWQAGWTKGFALGSWLTAIAHGLILARLVTAYATGWTYSLLGVFLAACMVASYSLLGASWLLMRVSGALRTRSIVWARRTVRWFAAGSVAISVILALSNTGVLLKWGSDIQWTAIASLWVVLLLSFISLEMALHRLFNDKATRLAALPFFIVLFVFLVLLGGLAYSFFPYLVLDNVTLWDGAASLPSLQWVLSAAVIGLPVAILFNVWVYWGMFIPLRQTDAYS